MVGEREGLRAPETGLGCGQRLQPEAGLGELALQQPGLRRDGEQAGPAAAGLAWMSGTRTTSGSLWQLCRTSMKPKSRQAAYH